MLLTIVKQNNNKPVATALHCCLWLLPFLANVTTAEETHNNADSSPRISTCSLKESRFPEKLRRFFVLQRGRTVNEFGNVWCSFVITAMITVVPSPLFFGTGVLRNRHQPQQKWFIEEAFSADSGVSFARGKIIFLLSRSCGPSVSFHSRHSLLV